MESGLNKKILEGSLQQKAGLPSTLMAHYLAWQNSANIVRVHDVEAHFEMLNIIESLHAIDIDML